MQAESSLPDLRRNASFRVFDGVSRFWISDCLIIDFGYPSHSGLQSLQRDTPSVPTSKWLSLWRHVKPLEGFIQVAAIPKMAAEDTSILVGNINGEKTAVPVPKGSLIQLNVAGLHYNRAHFLSTFSL